MTDKEQSKLRWYCRRGMRELDVLLNDYLENHYLNSSSEKQITFKELLLLEDPVLFSMLLGNMEIENALQADIIQILRNSSKTKKNKA
ncbi:MAG: succinate dehydrogenase assembly factor 2 [Cocleimonas sp.]